MSLSIFLANGPLAKINASYFKSKVDTESRPVTSDVEVSGPARYARDTHSDRQDNSQSPIVVNHYHHHHYYYCCPTNGSFRRLASATGLGCAPDCRCTSGGKCTCQDPAGIVNCGCDMRGSCFCRVAESVLQTRNQRETSRKDKDLIVNTFFNDPIGKELVKFIKKNFVEKESDNDMNKSIFSEFNNSVCKEFFKLVFKSLKKKSKTKITSHVKTTLFKNALLPRQKKKKNRKDNTRYSRIKDILSEIQQYFREEMKDITDGSRLSFEI